MKARIKKLAIFGTDHGHCNAIISAATMRKDVKLVAIAQESANDSASSIAEKFQVPHYTDYYKCLNTEKPDIAGVAMYNGARGNLIAELARRNIPVISDKPLCTTINELRLIKDAFVHSRNPVCMMLTCRSLSPYIAMKNAVLSGTIGRITGIDGVRYYALDRPTRPDWMFKTSSYGGPGLDILIHDYDLARWISGYKWNNLNLTEIRTGVYEDDDFKDSAFLAAEDNGATLNLKMMWHSPKAHWRRFTIYGTSGFIDLPFGSNGPTLTTAEGKTELQLHTATPFAAQFFRALLDGDSLPISSEEGFDVVENIIRARDKTCSGKNTGRNNNQSKEVL